MSDMCLLDFEEKGKDDFSNLRWESELIKAVDLDCDKIFQFKRRLTTQRVPKKKRLEFRVIFQTAHQDHYFEIDDLNDFKTEQNARECFENQKAHLEFLHEKNKENKVFDGRRYMWKLDAEGKITGEKGWS